MIKHDAAICTSLTWCQLLINLWLYIDARCALCISITRSSVLAIHRSASPSPVQVHRVYIAIATLLLHGGVHFTQPQSTYHNYDWRAQMERIHIYILYSCLLSNNLGTICHLVDHFCYYIGTHRSYNILELHKECISCKWPVEWAGHEKGCYQWHFQWD